MSKSNHTICCKLLIVAFSTSIVSFFELSAQQVPQFRENLQNTVVFSGPSPIHRKIIWKFKTGGIVVSSSIAYKSVVYFGSNESYFYAVNTQNGELKWKFKSDRKIYVGSAIGT